jgi:hypothetical protein
LISNIFGAKYFLKKMLCDKNNFFKTNCPFSYQKSLTYLICGKYMVEAFCNALMSKSCVSFKKIVFTIGFTQFGGKDKTRICFAKIEKCCYLIANFDLWICKGTHDVFALIISFLNMDW